MSKQEISQELLREGLTKYRDELIEIFQEIMEEALEKDKKTFEVEIPDLEDRVYLFDDGDTEHIDNGDLEVALDAYGQNYLRGLIFNSREEAMQYDKERVLLFKIKKWAELQNGYYNFKDRDRRYYIYYDKFDKEFDVSYEVNCNSFSKLPYFKAEEIAQACIDEFGDEILEVLVNE